MTTPPDLRRLRQILRSYLAPRVVDEIMAELRYKPKVRVSAEIEALANADIRRQAG